MLTDATADIAFALLLHIARRITEGERQVRDGEWVPWYPTHMIGGDTAGHDARASSAGAGSARRWRAAARASGCTSSTARARRASRSSSCSSEADYVSLHTPLTPETRHLIGAPELRRMKPSAYLINTARGGVVDQVALREALEQGEIAGAGLDVTTPSRSRKTTRCCSAPNLLVVPHVGSATIRTRSRMADMAVDNLLAALGRRGHAAPGVVSRVAAVDIGTNSTRLLIAEGDAELARASIVTRLGEGVDTTGQLGSRRAAAGAGRPRPASARRSRSTAASAPRR